MGTGIKEPSFTIGLEEEYHLVDIETRDVVSDPPDSLFMEVGKAIGDEQVSPEFLRSQLEVGTKVCNTMPEARAELARLRKGVSEVAANYGMAPIAASTHPFALWQDQKHTAKERYELLAKDLQAVIRRLLICGGHVHVGIEDDELRIDLMNQVAYFLPHLLALSTSSPFWGGAKTGLMSYRLSVFNELPRTGLPEMFDSYVEYERHVNTLVSAGVLEDASKIWWDVRPSCKFPTLEVRIGDMCTRIDDAIAIAALYRCLLRMLYRLRRNNQRWRQYATMLVQENRWRAQRYGFDEGLVDFGQGKIVPYAELLEELLYLVREDIEFFGCEEEMDNVRRILDRGTSAHRQLRVYEDAVGLGEDKEAALCAVVDDLISQTVRDI